MQVTQTRTHMHLHSHTGTYGRRQMCSSCMTAVAEARDSRRLQLFFLIPSTHRSPRIGKAVQSLRLAILHHATIHVDSARNSRVLRSDVGGPIPNRRLEQALLACRESKLLALAGPGTCLR